RGSRLSGHTFSPAERVPRAPAVVGSRATVTTASALSNFNGTSSRDSEFTNYGLEFEPPDQGLCEANGFVLEPVNSAYRIFLTNGRSIRGPFNINDLSNVGGKEFTNDTRCWYDPELWVINKAGLVAGNPTVKFAHFGNLKIDGQTTLASQSALSTVKPHAEFMLQQLDLDNQGDNRIGVWAITGRAKVASGGLP